MTHLQESVGEFDAYHSFMDLMHQSMMVSAEKHETTGEGTEFAWLELPGLCCQAAGGDPKEVIGITAAWSLLYTAAHTMDAVQDQDEPDAWWAHLGYPVAINTATGLYSISTLLLMEILGGKIPHSAAISIIREFQLSILRMCSGQHIDITFEVLDLEDYWQVAEMKSGSFFELCCFAGARTTTDDPEALSSFRRFGRHLGILLQISDDTHDVWSLLSHRTRELKNAHRLLPIIYTLAVSPPEKRSELEHVIHEGTYDGDSIDILRSFLDETGAAFYLITKAEQHRLCAQEAIAKYRSSNTMYNRLVEILDQVSILKKV